MKLFNAIAILALFTLGAAGARASSVNEDQQYCALYQLSAEQCAQYHQDQLACGAQAAKAAQDQARLDYASQNVVALPPESMNGWEDGSRSTDVYVKIVSSDDQSHVLNTYRVSIDETCHVMVQLPRR